MPNNTLTSLAILKVNVDQGNDYLDYLRPFVLQVLIDHSLELITDERVSEYIQDQFGLAIPVRTVQIVMRRLSRSHTIKKRSGIYRITGSLPDPNITTKQAVAEAQINTVLQGIQDFSKRTTKPITTDDQAIRAISALLAEFDVSFLRSYLRGTAIPTLDSTHQTDVILVSKYIQHLQRKDPVRFNNFLVMVQGHMLANALLCPDLNHASRSYKNVTFYLDTPLLVRRLGSEDEPKQVAIRALIDLLRRLDGKVAAFSHSRRELQGVFQGAANNLESPAGRGAIVFEARRRGTTRSDLLLLAASLDDELDKAGIEVIETPRHINEFQIDETIFTEFLEDEVWYYNPRAKEYDINSVRSIYVLRGSKPTPSVEKSRAILVTSNSAFAKAAWVYGQQIESARDVSSVITDFALANMAWLKAPVGAPAIPTTQLLAFSYAALQPSAELLEKYLTEIDKLERQGTISARDHQLLRSSPVAYDELMQLTLGSDASVNAETISETLERVEREIREETEKQASETLMKEEAAHQSTRDELDVTKSHVDDIVSNLYWRCREKAKFRARVIAVAAAIAVAIPLVVGLGFFGGDVVGSVIFGVIYVPFALITYFSLLFGTNVKSLENWAQGRILNWLLTRESRAIGIDLTGVM